MEPIEFVDTTLRDGHQSLWAESMRTGMMLAVGERMDRAGFKGMELMSSSHIKKCVRELHEDPWERIRLVAGRIRETPLRVIIGSRNGFELTPESIQRIFLERMAANGVRQGRISDEWNDVAGWRKTVRIATGAGLEPILNIIYSVSPKHTDAYFAERARQAATVPVARICFKDPGGLLTPDRTRTLVPLIMENIGGIPLEFHTHCTTGLGPLCALEAIKQGIRIINTALPPLANGSSNPSLFNVAANARSLGYETAVGRGGAAAGVRLLHRGGPPRGAAHRRAGGVRLQPVSAPGARRHDLEPAPPTRAGRSRGPYGKGPGGGGAGARGAGVSHHGHAAVPVRRQPGGHQTSSSGSVTRRSRTR